MVPLEKRSQYFETYLGNPKYAFFYDFVFKKKSRISFTPSTEFDIHLKSAVEYFLTDNKEGFMKNALFFEERKPSMEAPYIHDDFLLFTLLCGYKKFDLKYQWVLECLNLRNASNQEEKLKKQTLINIANKNYESTDNEISIIIVFERLISQSLLESKFKRQFYNEISQRDFPPFDDVFLNMLAIRGFDIVLTEWDRSDNNNLVKLEKFEAKFLTRTKYLTIAIYAIAVITLSITAWIYISNPLYKDFFDVLDKVMGIVGFSVLGIASYIAFPYLLKIIRIFFGYKNY